MPDDLLKLRRAASGVRAEYSISAAADDLDGPASVLLVPENASLPYGDDADATISIEGIWGWHDRWTEAWRDSGDSLRDTALDAASEVITVRDASGSDQDGREPRFQVGQLLRIKDEYLRVTAIDSANNRLTVLRGVQGTAAAAHRRGASIETYTPPAAIRDLTLRFATLMTQSAGLLERESTPLLERLRRVTAIESSAGRGFALRLRWIWGE